ncbi:UNVERIFIED_CONTAM: hypothetical protein FKN15_005432 [Acipenser sinensis]
MFMRAEQYNKQYNVCEGQIIPQLYHEDEDEKFSLASESKEPSSEQRSESLDPSSVEGDLADVDSGGISESKFGDIERKEKECRAVIEDIRGGVGARGCSHGASPNPGAHPSQHSTEHSP